MSRRIVLLLSRRLAPLLIGVLLVIAAVIVSATTKVSLPQLFGDTASVAGVSPYIGALSMTGILLWCVAATVCVFSASLLRDREGMERVTRFLTASGGLTGLLMLDDAFQVHEHAFLIGASEPIVFGFYAIAAGVLFWSYRDLVLASETVLLLIAIGLFALGLGSDVLRDLDLMKIPGPNGRAIGQLLENGAEFLGIVAWLNYYVWTCLDYLRADPDP